MEENPAKIRQVFIKPDASLQRDQIRTLNVLRGQSKCNSIDAEPVFIERIQKVMKKHNTLAKYDTQMVVESIATYIAERAPLVIHVASSVVPKLIEGTHYKSAFEVANYCGGKTENKNNYMDARYKWESECFLKLYDDVTSVERPKYGALNFLNKLSGGAPIYGKNYLILGPHVRKRITIATGDTSGSRCLGVLDFCYHVLTALTDIELMWLIKIAMGLADRAPETCHSATYREIQIHGEINIARDVEAFCVGEDLHIPIVDSFQNTFGVPVIYQGV